MMRIAIISKYFPPNIKGGGEISAYNIADGLAEQGAEVHVITSKNVSRIADSKFILHSLFEYPKSYKLIDPIIQNEIFYINSFKALNKFLSRHTDFDIINAWNMYSIPATIKAAIIHKIPSVITINSHWLTCPSGWMMRDDYSVCTGECNLRKMFRCYSDMKFPENIIGPVYSMKLMRKRIDIAKKADAVICISKSLESYVKKVIEKKSYVVPNIVELEKYNQPSEEEIKSDILFLGNLEKAKGCEILIRAMSEITDRIPDIKLRIVGRGPLEELLKEMSISVGLERNVLFEGFVDHKRIPSYYASTSIVVFPSVWPEPFGRISIEAMAAGKPIVASRVGGIPEVVDNCKTGILVEPGNSHQLAEAVLYLLEKKDIAKKMGTNGIMEAKKYSSENISKRYIEIYQNIIMDYWHGVK